MQGNFFRSLPSLLIIISWVCATSMEKGWTKEEAEIFLTPEWIQATSGDQFVK